MLSKLALYFWQEAEEGKENPSARKWEAGGGEGEEHGGKGSGKGQKGKVRSSGW